MEQPVLDNGRVNEIPAAYIRKVVDTVNDLATIRTDSGNQTTADYFDQRG